MTKPVRLLCALDLERSQDIYALNLDTKQECIIDCTEAAGFIAECPTWDADSFDAGRCIQVGMSAESWQLWLEGYQLVEPSGYVALTCATEASECITALSLIGKQEVIAPPDEASQFMADCHGWDAHRFNAGYSIVVRMAAEEWASWLEIYQVDATPIALVD